MFVARLNQAKNTAPFIRSASVTIDMSYISPRVRTLAKKIVRSRKFDRYARSQSGILAYAVYTTFAPEGTPASTHWNYMDNPQMTPDWLARVDELVRTDETLSRMRSSHMYRGTTPVDECVERTRRSLERNGLMPYVTEELRPQRAALMAEALTLGAERDAEITAMMCEPLDSKRLVFTVNI
jgi:hypothetical protein